MGAERLTSSRLALVMLAKRRQRHQRSNSCQRLSGVIYALDINLIISSAMELSRAFAVANCPQVVGPSYQLSTPYDFQPVVYLSRRAMTFLQAETPAGCCRSQVMEGGVLWFERSGVWSVPPNRAVQRSQWRTAAHSSTKRHVSGPEGERQETPQREPRWQGAPLRYGLPSQ